MTKELLQIWILALFTILITQLLSAQVGTVSGFIYDQTSGIPLSFVNVWVKSTSRGTASNQDGYYILFLSPGKYLIVYSIVGYQRLEKEVVIRENENINLNVYLVPDSVEIDTVEVESLPNTNMEPRTIIVRRNEIEKIPPFLGEFDLLKTLPSFPGVVERDFSSRLYIQGGYPENNLILVDGVEVYNIEHSWGIISVFNSKMVKSVELIKGGFDATYGDRTSSVINITTREGNKNKICASGNVSLVSFSGVAEGPTINNGSWIIGIRRTYFDLLFPRRVLPDYHYFDFNFKIAQPVSKNSTINISSFIARDRLVEEGDLRWGTKVIGLNYVYLLNPNWIFNIASDLSSFGLTRDFTGENNPDYLDIFGSSIKIRAQNFYKTSVNELGLELKKLDLDQWLSFSKTIFEGIEKGKRTYYYLTFYFQNELRVNKFFVFAWF